MTSEQPDIQRLNPDDLMAGFSRSNVGMCLVVAVAAHVVIVGALSVRYIGTKLGFIQPPAKVQPGAATQPATQPATAPATTAPAPEERPDEQPASKPAAKQPDPLDPGGLFKE